MKKSILGASVLMAIVLTLTGCSKSTQAVTVGDAPSATSSAVAVEAGAKRVLTAEQATAALVTADQLGTNWVAGSTSTGTPTPEPGETTFSPASCAFSATDGSLSGTAVIDPKKKPLAEATAEFHEAAAEGAAFNFNVHGVSVGVKSYKDDLDETKLQDVRKKLTECATFSSTDPNGVTSNWQILPMSLPNYGDGTLAFRLQGNVSMFVLLVDVVEIVSGHNLVSVIQTGLGKIDTKLAAHVAEQVMTNLDTAAK